MKRRGFTLVELITVIVILVVLFLFITPRMISLINGGKNKQTKLLEQRVLSAAKEYINTYDSNFYKELINVGDVNYIYKSDLINTGLIDENEVSELVNFTGVKGKLLDGDKVEYTVEYINNPSSEYSNQELYLMIQSLTNRLNNITNVSGGEYTILDAYPVGSIYISVSSVNPSTLFGGTWAPFGTGKTLVSIDSNDNDFAIVERTGGSKAIAYTPSGTVGNHTLTISQVPAHTHKIKGGSGGTATLRSGYATYGGTSTGNYAPWFGGGYSSEDNVVTDSKGGGGAHNHPFTGTSSSISVVQPYITVYMFKRTS